LVITRAPQKFENKIFKKVFEIHNTSCFRQIAWYRQEARMGRKVLFGGLFYYANAYRISVGKSEGKRPLRRPIRRSEDNIKIDLRYDGVVCTGLIRLRTGISGGLL
jgi:hypothetical protein